MSDDVVKSIDGVDYHLAIVNGEAFMEPGHDRILQSTRIGDYTLFFSQASCYRVYTPQGPATKENGEQRHVPQG